MRACNVLTAAIDVCFNFFRCLEKMTREREKVPLEYALFQSSLQVVDSATGLLYSNMFDAELDAIYFALTAMNFKTVKVMVTRSGWPSRGSPKKTAATLDNALA